MNENNNFSVYTTKTVSELMQDFGTSPEKGLTQDQAKKRLQQFGSNEIKSKEAGWSGLLLRQFQSPFIYLLLAVAVISFFLQNHVDGAVILSVVALNALFGFFQEYKAAKTLKLLKQYIISKVIVIRDGQETEILNSDLVPGDIVVLYPGDIIPADVRFIQDQNLTVDESVLTGESVTVKKNSDVLAAQAIELFKATNIGFWGTTIMTGKALGLVFATGVHTALGDITKLTVETNRLSSFEKGIARFSAFILRLMLISIVVIFIAHFIIKGGQVDFIELTLFCCALAVTVVPEALPIVTMFALSQGAMRLAQRKAVVKRLSAIEDLGNIEILCTDKTGTLTENVSVVESVYGEPARSVIFYGALVSTFYSTKFVQARGFDLALFKYLTQDEQKQLDEYKRIAEIPFDPTRRRNLLLTCKSNEFELISRGSPEDVLACCSGISDSLKAELSQWIQNEGFQGRRILAVARKKLTGSFDHSTDLIPFENDMEFVGLIGFGDPLKKTAHEAIKKARLLNVEIKILSGDTPEVCGAIAYQVGLITDRTQVITGTDFATKSDQEKYDLVRSMNVFARISPQQKYEIITLLQQDKEVGYIGDGINDAPALKVANVALAVQDAAGIAREAADIILLKKSLLVIVEGIEEGRRIFANTLKYIRTTLSTAFGNFYSVGLISLFVPYLPLLPVQLLLINVLPDFPMLAIATDTMDPAELRRPAKYDVRSFILLATILGLISSMFDFIFFALFSRISPVVLQTGWFIENILTALIFIFSIRTTKPFFKGSRPSMPLVILAIAVAIVSMALPYTALGQKLFSFVPLEPKLLLWIFGIVITYFITTDSIKCIYYRYYRKILNHD